MKQTVCDRCGYTEPERSDNTFSVRRVTLSRERNEWPETYPSLDADLCRDCWYDVRNFFRAKTEPKR